MLAAALLALAVAVPGAAAADDNPLSKVPPEFEQAIDVAAKELGVSADELQNSSRDDLQKLLCDELEGESAADVAARVKAALDSASADDLGGLSEAEVTQLQGQLPGLISQLKSACADAAEDVEETSDADADDADDEDDADDAPTPTNIETGAGGLTDASGAAVPLVFGGAFALLFGAFGFAVARTRRNNV
jgi:hypothetical protein